MMLSPSTRATLRILLQGPLILLGALALLFTIRSIGEAGGWGPRQVLALGVGMSACVLVTAGFVYSVGRRVSICLIFRDIRSASAFMGGALGLAGASVLVTGALLVMVATAVGLFESHEILTFGLAYLGFSAIWLLSSGLSLLRAPGWVGCSLAAGLGAGLIVNRVLDSATELHLPVAIITGFATTFLLVAAATRHELRRIEGRRDGRVSLPALGYLITEAAPYFIYGALYAQLLFAPHLLGWLAAFSGEPPRLLALVSLEAALTLSLPPLVLASGFAEHALEKFWRYASATQARTRSADSRRFDRMVRDFHGHELVRYLLVLGLFATCTSLIFGWSAQSGALVSWLGFEQLDTVMRIFVPTVAANLLLGWGLFNCMFALTLARPWLAVEAVSLGVAGAVLIGIAGGAWWGLSGVVVGAVVGGSAVFVIASTRMIRRVFGSAHYYYATAY